jgi:hypothetical protein
MQKQCKTCERLWSGKMGEKGCLAQSQVSARLDPVRYKQAVDFWMGKGDICPFQTEKPEKSSLPHRSKLVMPESARLTTNVHKKEA